MKKIGMLAVILLLGGCATPAERRNSPPVLDLTSNKSAKEVALCIAEKWENITTLGIPDGIINTNIRPNGYSVTTTRTNGFGTSSVLTLADVAEIKTASATRYYRQAIPGYGKQDQAVKDCQ